MPIYKRCSRCGKRLGASDSCQCSARKAEKQGQGKSKEKEFYSSTQWREARNLAATQYFLLDIYSYYVQEKIEFGAIVHHIVPIKVQWNLRLQQENLILLTEQNHAQIHKQMETKGKELEVFLESLIHRWKKEMVSIGAGGDANMFS